MTLRGIDNLRNQYYLQSRRLLGVIGLCPYQKASIRLPYVCFILVILAVDIPSQICVLSVIDFKLDLIMDSLQTFLPTLCFACCYCNLLYNLPMVKRLFDRVRYNWTDLANEQEELNVMQKYAKQTELWILSITCLCYLYAVFLMFPSIINFLLFLHGITNHTKLVLPFPQEYSVENKVRYFPMFSLQLIIISIISTLGVANYSILVSFLQHARALFTITTLRIDRPFKGNCDSSTTKLRSFTSIDKEQEWIISVITSYNDSIKFVELIKTAFGKSYLIETFIALLCIIVDYLYVFQMFTTSKGASEMLRDCIYIGATLLITYAYCYLGQKIIDHNAAVFTKCCQVPFYMLSLKTQKVLLLLIVKTMRPCNFSITKLIVTSHELFATLIRISFSYALVFHNAFRIKLP